MYKYRLKTFSLALENYKKKEQFIYSRNALIFSYAPTEGIEPWNNWSVMPWEADPYNYRFLRRSVATLIRLVQRKKIAYERFAYLLDTAESQQELQAFPMWHSNELFTEHPFGGTVPILFSERQYFIPSEFLNLPYTFFFLLRFFVTNFYRFRKIPSKGNCLWGFHYSFMRVPSRFWNLEHQPGLLRVIWSLPVRFLCRWTFREDDRYATVTKYYDRRTRWFKSERALWKSIWFPPRDAETHRQFLSRLEHLSIKSNSHPGAKRFFVNFFLSLRHSNYEYFAVDLPILFRMRTWIGKNYLRKIIYFTREGDILRFYIFSLYNRMQFDTDHVDRMLDFVSWLDFLKWEGTLFPLSDYWRVCGKSLDVIQAKVNVALDLPNFSKIRKTFWWKK